MRDCGTQNSWRCMLCTPLLPRRSGMARNGILQERWALCKQLREVFQMRSDRRNPATIDSLREGCGKRPTIVKWHIRAIALAAFGDTDAKHVEAVQKWFAHRREGRGASQTAVWCGCAWCEGSSRMLALASTWLFGGDWAMHRSKFYCLRQVHLAENLPQATHTQNRVKTTQMRAKACFTYLGWSF